MSTGIQWTDETWNPVVGCNQVSAGCDHCYAKTLHDMRHRAVLAGKKLAPQYAEPFETVQLMPARLAQPLSWRKPRRVFVNSVSDLFHKDVPDSFLDQVFAVMAIARRHTFQILTKRAGRMRSYMSDPSRLESIYEQWYAVSGTPAEVVAWPMPNVWLGVSVENRAAQPRITALRETPAAIRFISFEPLLEAVDPSLAGIDWAIIGGESGKGARPFDLAWARALLFCCDIYDAAPFVKQLGGRPVVRNDERSEHWPGSTVPIADHYQPHHQGEMAPLDLRDSHGGDMAEWPEDLRVREFPGARP